MKEPDVLSTTVPEADADIPLTLKVLAELHDVPASAPIPRDLIAHLRLCLHPSADKANAVAALSAPKGYAPRLSRSAERALLQGVTAHGHSLGPDEPQQKASVGTNAQDGPFRPAHLALRRIPRLIPTRTGDIDMGVFGPVQALRWEVAGQDMQSWPWSTIGHIEAWSEGVLVGGGTGFLVGRNLLVTASHVMPWAHSGNCSISFTPAWVKGVEPPFGQTWNPS